MSRILSACALAFATLLTLPATGSAQAPTERQPAASTQNPGAEHAPTNRMDKLVPPMTGDKAAAPNPNSDAKSAEHPPTGRVDKAVPQMKGDDAKRAEKDASQTGANTGAQKPN